MCGKPASRPGRSAAEGAVVDINLAIDVYSHQGGNCLKQLQAICADSSVTEALAAEISGLQEGIYELIRAQAGTDGLPRAQVEQVARQYLASARRDVNEVGLNGLLRYVFWIAWHDGWLQRDGKKAEPDRTA
jgi:hypothetical protein